MSRPSMTRLEAEILSGAITQAILRVLQDRGVSPSIEVAGAMRVATIHVLEGKDAATAAELVKNR